MQISCKYGLLYDLRITEYRLWKDPCISPASGLLKAPHEKSVPGYMLVGRADDTVGSRIPLLRWASFSSRALNEVCGEHDLKTSASDTLPEAQREEVSIFVCIAQETVFDF